MSKEYDGSAVDALAVIACGAGLFSDGYLNNVIRSVNTMLRKIYPGSYANSTAQNNVSSITFVGTVIGMLFFWIYIRSLFPATGLFGALTAYRFFLGIGIGGEYPAGSVGCAESTGELKQGTRNRWFIMFTNEQIDLGFVVAAIVPMIVVLATTETHLRAAWRICLGLGMLPPLSLLYLRIKLQWLLCIRLYWFRLLVISIIWFIYDFSAYSFGIYPSSMLANLAKTIRSGNPLVRLADMPKLGIVGFIMAGCYAPLSKPSNAAGFVVVYGLILALGEVGPGDNIGLVASKTSATAIRGRCYGIAAAIGKVGAFDNAPNETHAGQDPFFVSSALAIFSSLLALFLLPNIEQNTIDAEDTRFRKIWRRMDMTLPQWD
ncbi:hypothetical protein M501DRAFT_1006549 [Patellaria atrata CBS 101060]|uniref:MFS general substrate transporter n=1 Tax=Patellaria atrata CBS 101060 TaxID=1346257 RepID=A0A9P4VQ64_9PEZI|nr:hypothetical protein M501DRAFT_1006549 [Patellaria atrata CBS 101060]